MRWLLSAGLLGIALIASPVAAQVTVQQPVVQSFGTSTSVSVPDRGRIVLGGVSSAAASRSTTGPFRSGAPIGMEARGSSMSVGVFIHDLREMDEALLASARSTPAAAVWEHRLAERRGSLPSTPAAARAAKPVNRAAEFEALAQRAEDRGKSAVAQVYWRMAAKDGSALAQSKVTESKRRSSAIAASSR